MRPAITTKSPVTGREYRIRDDRGRQWFSAFSPDGSGFGYLTWTLKRPVGYDWHDIGYGYEVTMRKGPFLVLFDGQIVRISERSGEGGDEIEVWALGWVHVAENDRYNAVYCDTRPGRWVGDETPSGSFVPDCFDYDLNDRLYIRPRRGIDFSADDYIYLRYTFPFGETAARFVADYDLALPSSWPGKLEVRDSTGAVLWSATSTATGSLDLTPTAGSTYVEVRFYVTAAGENTADDDTVYGKLTGVKVFSVSDSTVDAGVVAKDVADRLTALGLSDDTDLIESPGLALEPCVFENDRTCGEVLRWVCQFGDANGDGLVWGVAFDGTRRLFLRTRDTTTVRYVVKVRPRPGTLERSGDWGESGQTVYGVYTDDVGEVQRTDDRSNDSVIESLGGYYRRVAVQIEGMTDESLIEAALDVWLAENAYPTPEGSFVVRDGVYTPELRFVPFDEVTPGGLVQVREWRAFEVELSAEDYRDKKTTYPLAGVRVDEDQRTVELIPNRSSDAFKRQMAMVAELAG